MTDLTDEQGAAKRQKLDHLADVNGTHAEADGNQEGFAAVAAIHEELQQLSEEEQAKVLEIEQHYRGRRKEAYERRSKVLANIKGFWLTVLEHSSIREYVNDYDKTILEYMTSMLITHGVRSIVGPMIVPFRPRCIRKYQKLDVYDDDANSSVTIALSFQPNPFFSNKVLTRTSTRVNDEQINVTCSEVNWKEGQDLQNYVNEEDGEALIAAYTFMNWFTSEGVYDESAEDGVDQIAYIIRQEVWENALNLYNAEFEEQPEGEGAEEGEPHALAEGDDGGDDEDGDADEEDPDEAFEDEGSDEEEAAVDEEEDEDEQDAL